MEPKDLTIPLIVSWGGTEVFNEGLRLSQRHGEVTSNWDPVNHVIYGEIMEDADWSRPVRFELLDDGSVRSHCLCPQNQQWGQVCKHVVAVGLHLMVKYQKDEEERAAAASGTRVAIPPEALATREAPVNVAIVAEYFEDEGQFALFPQADLPEGVEHILSQDRYFVSGDKGYVLAAGRWYPIRRVLSGPFQAVYREDQFISREAMPAFIRNNLPLLRRQVEVRMSPSEDMFTFMPDKPQMRAKIYGSTTSALSVEVIACYGEAMVPLCGPAAPDSVCRPDPEDMLLYHVRNMKAEKVAEAELLRWGFREATPLVGMRAKEEPPKATRYELDEPRSVLNFLGSGLPALRRRGWRFEPSVRFNALMETLPMITPVVTIRDVPGAGGAFDVSYSFDGGKAGTVAHSEIQQALNRGDSYIKTERGTMLLDAGAVESMRDVFADCSSSGTKGGHFQVKGIYAPFVKASLEALDAIDFEDDEAKNWREVAAQRNRDKNAKFEAVPLGPLDNVLRPYQKQGVYWMRFLEKSGLSGLLADEMGLGKTLQTLTWISLARTDPAAQGKPALVVCPTSLVRNWEAEAAKFTPRLRRLVVSGPDRAKLFPLIEKADLVITSYALLQRDLEEAWLGKTFGVAVLDEAQHIKNRETRNAKSAKAIEAVCKLVLTGTPVENSVSDVWSIFDFLLPDYLGNYPQFKETVEEPIGAGGPQGLAAQEKLHHKLHPFILRRLKKDVAKDLPEKIVRVAYCPLSEAQQRLSNEIRQKAKGAKTKFEMLAVLMRLRQAANHTSLVTKEKGGESGKLDVFFELLDEAIDAGHRVLVFSQFVEMLSILREELGRRDIEHCYLDGATKDRLGECRRFNTDPSIPVFLISLHAGGTGLNLTGADMVVHFDPWWNPAVEAQATDRAHRIGQKKTVYVVKMIAEQSVEERVLALQQKKQLVIDATVGASDEAVVSKMSFDDLRAIAGV